MVLEVAVDDALAKAIEACENAARSWGAAADRGQSALGYATGDTTDVQMRIGEAYARSDEWWARAELLRAGVKVLEVATGG